jgi:hypothetical protein
MSDDLKERAPQDASRISLTEDREVRYWTKALGSGRKSSRDLLKRMATLPPLHEMHWANELS